MPQIRAIFGLMRLNFLSVMLLPAGLSLLLAMPMAVLTSKTGVGQTLLSNNYLLILEETKSPAVLRRAWLHAGLPSQRVLALAA